GHAYQVADAFREQAVRQPHVIDASGIKHPDVGTQIGSERPTYIAILRRRVVGRRDIGTPAPSMADIDVQEVEQTRLRYGGHHLPELGNPIAALAGLATV